MLACPSCSGHLCRTRTESGLVYLCDRCAGRLASFSVLRQDHVHQEFMAELWQTARKAHQASSHPCPHCRKNMVMASVATGTDEFYVVLDVCRICQCVWFDPGEFGAPARDLPPEPEPLPQKAREALAMAEVKKIAERGYEGDYSTEEGPDRLSQVLPAVFGLPTELHPKEVSRSPLVTWSVIVACTLTTIFGDVQSLGFIPDEPMRLGGLTFISSFFMHGSIIHLASNMYFLLIFGDNVEDELGHGRMLLLLAGAALVGLLLHGIFDPRGDIPCVGASGGISGVLAYYAVAFPEARLGLFLRIGIIFKWVSFSAAVGMLLWLGLQGLIVIAQLSGAGAVSALAHLGGALVGAIAAFRCKSPKF